jgi:hypothetical protein
LGEDLDDLCSDLVTMLQGRGQALACAYVGPDEHVGTVASRLIRVTRWLCIDDLQFVTRVPGLEAQEGPKRCRWGRMRRAIRPEFNDGGFSMIAIALSLLATAVLTAILLSTMLDSGGASSGTSGGISNAPGVEEATALQAQQALTDGLTAAETAAVAGGGFGSLQPAALSASEPSTTFVTGPSTNPTTVSMAVTGAADAQPGADIEAAGGIGGTGGDGGSITLAARSTNGTCWLVWKSSGGSTWYGAQSGQSSCTAPAIAAAPSPGSVSSSTIGWQPSSFPTT